MVKSDKNLELRSYLFNKVLGPITKAGGLSDNDRYLLEPLCFDAPINVVRGFVERYKSARSKLTPELQKDIYAAAEKIRRSS